ncbi:MAG: hypothetical protein R3249_08085 [Nitriliruptorales bacterium]|nr:hypothetical protein [Nitriliruptorales bacterium]
MSERLPSLDLLLDLVQRERDKQLAHHDALDNKAGIVLGFAGLLITFAPNVWVGFRIAGVLAAAGSIALALAAFWPRRFPVLQPSALRRYLRAEESFTRLTVHDTFEDFVNEGSDILQAKGRRLGRALALLSLAATVLALGIVVETL